MKKLLLLFVVLNGVTSYAQSQKMQWISSTANEVWQQHSPLTTSDNAGQAGISINSSKTYQVVEGFGTCFNELGWTSLSLLDSQSRENIMSELFAPGLGANFTICRMPIGANDFALDWYSYNETNQDFKMKNFSIEHDKSTLIPFIKNAQKYSPAIKIWASPWSPPSWMKHNKHYAATSSSAMIKRIEVEEKANNTNSTSTYMFKKVDNKLSEDKQGKEGTDMFIVEDSYMKAYALYFSKFIDAYNKEGIPISMVAPQNEFNSAQIFPSCTWTSKSLAKFLGQYLGPAMKKKNVTLMMGTVERPNALLTDTVLADAAAKKYITAVGFQWAGKDALPSIAKKYSNLTMYQTEQECGNGKNDWKGAEYSWNLMKHYFDSGTSVYTYWNTSLIQGGISRWGWAQNSLVVVEEDGKSYRYTPEYYVMKHASHYIKAGAKRIDATGNAMAFINPDNSIIVLVSNQEPESKTMNITIDNKTYSPKLKANSLNTFVIEKN